MPPEAVDIRSPEAVVTGGCGLPDLGAETLYKKSTHSSPLSNLSKPLFSIYFLDTVLLYITGWSGTCDPLAQLPKYWNHPHVPLCPP